MKPIRILDCTLRDGGYCNQWKFGNESINTIINSLTESNIEIIECGFITNKITWDPQLSKYNSVESASQRIPKNKKSMYVAMINHGEYDVGSLPDYKKGLIDGIRIAFHKKKIKTALEDCKIIKKKGYKVFVQAMVTMSYSDEEFLRLIDEVNKIRPYAFYIVDSFGMMKKKDLIRYFSLIEHNLNSKILIGFHSHNNLQLAYSNAQSLLEMRSGRDIIIDTSIYGMGRGAGNLNTELFIDFLNQTYGSQYVLKPILNVMDEIINSFYLKNPWGYSLPNYLSAIHGAHPNYAGFLSDKNTLTIEAMDSIFSNMSDEKKVEFDKDYIEQVYLEYMNAGKIQTEHEKEIRGIVHGKDILLIAPGKSSEDCRDAIVQYVKNNKSIITVSVNFAYPYVPTDYVFISNLRRSRELPLNFDTKCITTSNINNNNAYLKVRYQDLLNEDEIVFDNAGLMAIKMFIKLEVNSIILAGFDGYSYDALENYANESKIMITKKAIIDATNAGMAKILSDYSQLVILKYLTKPKHYKLSLEKKIKHNCSIENRKLMNTRGHEPVNHR